MEKFDSEDFDELYCSLQERLSAEENPNVKENPDIKKESNIKKDPNVKIELSRVMRLLETPDQRNAFATCLAIFEKKYGDKNYDAFMGLFLDPRWDYIEEKDFYTKTWDIFSRAQNICHDIAQLARIRYVLKVFDDEMDLVNFYSNSRRLCGKSRINDINIALKKVDGAENLLEEVIKGESDALKYIAIALKQPLNSLKRGLEEQIEKEDKKDSSDNEEQNVYNYIISLKNDNINDYNETIDVAVKTVEALKKFFVNCKYTYAEGIKLDKNKNIKIYDKKEYHGGKVRSCERIHNTQKTLEWIITIFLLKDRELYNNFMSKLQNDYNIFNLEENKNDIIRNYYGGFEYGGTWNILTKVSASDITFDGIIKVLKSMRK